MFRILWRLTRGYRLRPWRSAYLRWRIETYWGLHAEDITFGQFWRFAWLERRELLRYLRSLGYRAEEAGRAIVEVKTAEGDIEELRLRLDLQLRVWDSVRGFERERATGLNSP